MNLTKIGNFISECRKKKNLTQKELAQKLNITDKAISKWENGKSFPDVMIMLDLCKILNISINDLLNGEVVDMENYKEKTEELLVELVKQKEKSDEKLLLMEVVILPLCLFPLIIVTIIVSTVPMSEWLATLLELLCLISVFIAAPIALRIEQIAGYYKCKKCEHTYVPTYKKVLFAPHMGRTRYMRCPKCNKKSWNKKVISKND